MPTEIESLHCSKLERRRFALDSAASTCEVKSYN